MRAILPNYTERAADCAAFAKVNWPNAVRRGVFDGEPRYYWQNIDGDFFTFATEAECAADFCQETGVTLRELESGVAY